MMGEYQRNLMNYIKANYPCYSRRKRAGMKPEELAELERQGDAAAMVWLDNWVPCWREGNPPTATPIYVTVSNDDEDDDDE